jgi:hypothetical protein
MKARRPAKQRGHSSQRYERLKRELASVAKRVGFLLTGTVQRRFFECGKNVNCHCHEDPANRHGPYHYWTRKVKGKTVSVSLTDQQATLFRDWMENTRALERLLKQMRRESMRVIAFNTGTSPAKLTAQRSG